VLLGVLASLYDMSIGQVVFSILSTSTLAHVLLYVALR
jgi:hypothetical protein